MVRDDISTRLTSGALTDDDLMRLAFRNAALRKRLILRSGVQLCHGSGILKSADPDVMQSRFRDMLSSRLADSDVDESMLGKLLPMFLGYSAVPEAILPFGFDEVRFSLSEISDPDVPDDLVGLSDELDGSIGTELAKLRADGGYLCDKCQAAAAKAFSVSAVQYRSQNGTWHGLEYFISKLFPNTEPTTRMSQEQWMSLLVSTWQKVLEQKQEQGAEVLVALPDLWIPGRPYEETQAHFASRRILRELVTTKLQLRQIHWRRLEELVAELLHDLGLEVTVTPRSSDGGRDVVGRGELLPGEPSVIAVEVKQMDVVPIPEVREALWANRSFTMLLFATAGRFSAGVIREAHKEETRLRLLLKDGVGLNQWIEEYARRNAWVAWP